jgi:hypothetical protein
MKYKEYNIIEKEMDRPYTYKVETFEDISDLISTLKSRPYNSNVMRGQSCSTDFCLDGWSGTKTYDEAMDLLTKGWTPESEKLTKKVPIKSISSNVKNSRPSYGVVGYQASVPRYLQGIPTSMVNRKPDVKKQKIITLYKSLSYNAGWSSEEIEIEGAKALQIIQALEGQGFRVKMNMAWMDKSGYEVVALLVCVKKPEERFSLAKMAFPLVHTSMLRRIGFKWLETNPNLTDYGFRGGYGRPYDFGLPAILEKNAYLLPHKIDDVAKFVESIVSVQS